MRARMTIKDIEDYLVQKNLHLESHVAGEIERLRLDAINRQDEEKANYCWCLRQIYTIQKQYLSAVNSLFEGQFENAWMAFDSADIALGYLELNYDLDSAVHDYNILFIGRMIKRYQKLFPYRHFLSRENIIKTEICTICGKPVSLRKSCGHKPGKIYMGKLCLRKVTSMEFKGVAVVTDPFDKYGFVRIPDQEYNYGMLEKLTSNLDSPYEEFDIETVREKHPDYINVGRNDRCPCGSGRKYKKCHRGTEEELIDHFIIHMDKHPKYQPVHPQYFRTWK